MMDNMPRYELVFIRSSFVPDGEYRVIDKTDGTAIGWMPTKSEALEYLGNAPFEDNTH